MKVGSFINWARHIPDINTFIWFLTNGHFLLLENGAYPDITAQNRAVQNPNALKTFQSSFPLLMNIFIVLATFLRRHRKIFNLLFFNRYFLPLSWSQSSSSSSSLRLSSQGKQLTGQKSLLLESEGSTYNQCTICCIKTLNTLAIY